MAFTYFLYNTNFNNTLVDRSATSFAPLPPNTGEIFIDFFIPENQPLYLYRESGSTIVLNDEQTIDSYLSSIEILSPYSNVEYGDFTGYTATTAINFNNKVDKTVFNTYTGTTAPATYLGIANFNSYSASTLSNINNRLLTSSFNSYSATTLSIINGKVNGSLFNSYTGTTAPNQFAAKTNFNIFTGTTAPATYQSKASIVILTGTTLPATYQTKASINTYTGTTAPAQFVAKTNFNTYTGTTVPNTYLSIANFNSYSASTLSNINNRLLTSSFNAYSAATQSTINGKLNASVFNTYTGDTDNRLNGIDDDIAFISGRTIGGNNTQVQFNNNGVLAGDSNFIFTNGEKSLTLGNRLAGTLGNNSFSQGVSNVASGINSHAEGSSNTASGINSHAEGISSTASGNFSHAEGNTAQALGQNSHAEGRVTVSSGNTSHAEGFATIALGDGSHSGGQGTTLNNKQILASGVGSFIHSTNTNSQTSGHGTLANQSIILGGQDHNIESGNVRSAIIGGNLIKLTGTSYIDTTAVSNLAIMTTPSTGIASDNILIRRGTTGKIFTIPQSTFATQANLNTFTGTTVPNTYNSGLTFEQGFFPLGGGFPSLKINTIRFGAGLSASFTGNRLDLVNTIPENVYGTQFQLAESNGASTSSATSPQTKVTLVTSSLPAGTYKVFAKWRFSHTSTSNSMLFDVTLNGSPVGTRTPISVEPKDTTDVNSLTLTIYQVLSGVNTILLRYWNEANSTTISDASIELIRVQ